MLHNYVAHYCELIISCPFDCALIEFIMPMGVLGLFFRLGCKRRLLLSLMPDMNSVGMPHK